jgi:type VI secretion system protein ImpG
MAKVDDSLVRYYQEELNYLRLSGQEFSKQYPKIARRLELSDGESSDPHVERLLESFAFLTARLSRAIDDRFPQTAQALLSVLYPHLINPIPAMAIAKLQIDTSQIPPDTGQLLPKGTKLLARSVEDVQCSFRTVYDLHLWPIEIQSVDLVSKDAFTFANPIQNHWFLKITLTSKGAPFSSMALDDLMVHINCEWVKANLLYEALFSEYTDQIYITSDAQTPAIGGCILEPVGYKRDELALPVPDYSLHHYALFQEYFHFSEKFLFFKIAALRAAIAKVNPKNEMHILIPLKNATVFQQTGVDASSFSLNCLPIINLFDRPSDPIRIHHRHLRYRLIPDIRRERTTEIYSVQSIEGIEEKTQKVVQYSPYYSLEAHNNAKDGFWLSQRVPAELRGMPGTDVYLSFIDRNFQPIKAKDIIATAKITCTNRYLADQLMPNSLLQPEDKAPLIKIVLLNKPASQNYTMVDGESLWMLISQLSSNYLGVLDPTQGIKALKDFLYLFASRYPNQPTTSIDDLKNMTVTQVTKRFGNEAWRGFVQGYKVQLEMEKTSHQGGTNLILGTILKEYFGALVNWNSFVMCSLNDGKNKGEWMQWQPQPGAQAQL